MICLACGHSHMDGLKPVEICVHISAKNGGVFYCRCPHKQVD